MIRHKFIIIILLTILFCSFIKDEIPFQEYEGGRSGYSEVAIRLYSDSLYYYYEWVHTGEYIKDEGIWKKINQKCFLNSTSTKYSGRGHKSKKQLRFKMQEFAINNNTLKFISADNNDKEFFEIYYSFLKVTNKSRGGD
jgi:hypothetical protein